MNEVQEQFLKTLENLKALAKTKKNTLEYDEILNAFNGMELTDAKIDMVLEYLEKNNIDVLQDDKKFFDLFVDFNGYVDFFYLQDCVSSGYCEVKMWLDEDFSYHPLPKTVNSYLGWINSNLDFVRNRNERIRKACQDQG